jgi:malonyl-CoA O-methyltransferase
VQQVARELRQIGAHNVNPGRPLGLSGRQRWTRLAEAYASLHDSGEGLPVSWQLCFLHLQKPAVN